MGRNNEFANGHQADFEPITAAAAAEFHNKNQGSSFYVHGGERASYGWSVGGLQGVPETVHESETLSPDQWQSHRDRVRASVPDPDAVAGSWVEGGKSVLDASNVVPDRAAARQLQINRGERAVYNLHEGREEDLR